MFDRIKTQYGKRLVIENGLVTISYNIEKPSVGIFPLVLCLYVKLFTFQYCNTESLVQRL